MLNSITCDYYLITTAFMLGNRHPMHHVDGEMAIIMYYSS